MRARITTLTVMGLLSLSACGGGDTEAESPAPSPSQTGPQIVVGLTEYALSIEETSLSAGTYTLVAEQQGGAPHALSIAGPGIETQTTDVLAPGDDPAELTVTLQPGTYELWCPVGTHRAQGMDATLTVS